MPGCSSGRMYRSMQTVCDIKDSYNLFLQTATQILQKPRMFGRIIAMIYLENFCFPDEERESDFFYRPNDPRLKRTCYDSFYPFQVLSRTPDTYPE